MVTSGADHRGSLWVGVYKMYIFHPEHIHPIIKQPGIREYWIDEFLFDDDPALSARERNHQQGRGGLGIVSLRKGSGMLIGKRDIILGRNIPDYT
ncbi:MAG: hypothetical protein ABIR06_10660 [Cyclobacteriaceae bacterium]